MLSRRLASAAVILSILVGLMVVDFYLGVDTSLGRPGLVLSVLAITVAVMSCYELVHLARQHHANINLHCHLLVSGIAVAICCVPVLWREYPADCAIGFFGWSMIAITFAVGMTLAAEVINYVDDGKGTSRSACCVSIQIQIILLFGFLAAHRLLHSDNALGMLALVTLITTVKMSDAAAYFLGKSIGKRKLAPTLSPGKTIEGFFGSIFGAILGCVLVLFVVGPLLFEIELRFPVWWVIVYSLAVSLAGVIGDLSESMMKRDARIKDSSSWLPGLGGVLDVTDSLVLAAPVSYFLWVLLN